MKNRRSVTVPDPIQSVPCIRTILAKTNGKFPFPTLPQCCAAELRSAQTGLVHSAWRIGIKPAERLTARLIWQASAAIFRRQRLGLQTVPRSSILYCNNNMQ